MSLDEKIGQISCYFNLPIGGEMEDVYPDGLERKVFIPGSHLGTGFSGFFLSQKTQSLNGLYV